MGAADSHASREENSCRAWDWAAARGPTGWKDGDRSKGEALGTPGGSGRRRSGVAAAIFLRYYIPKETMRTRSRARLSALILSDAQRFQTLKREIVPLDYFCKGTVLKRMMKCGQKQCACHRDPAKRHGPYFAGTYKIQNKTVNVRLHPDVTPLYRAAM